MKIIEVIFALVSGAMVAKVLYDFLRGYGFGIGAYTFVVLISVPILFVIFLWLAYIIGRKLLVVLQIAKHSLVGAFATVIDLNIFETMAFLFSLNPLLSKGFSFFVATSIKFLGNKQWSFEKRGRDGIEKEIIKFFIVAIVGVGIDVSSFFYFTNILGSQFQLPEHIWIKLSVIFAALIAAVWNFLGDKFLVFKK